MAVVRDVFRRSDDVLEGIELIYRHRYPAPLHSIREMRYETGPWTNGRPRRSLPGLELCYGSGAPCAVSVSQTTEPHPMSGRGHGWDVTPPPGTIAFAEGTNIGHLVRDGVYVTLQARSREELIAAAEALTAIP